MTGDETAIPTVGARGLDEVFEAISEANGRPPPWSGFEHGVLGSYRWAVGCQLGGPVTAVAAVLGAAGPCPAQLVAECEAAAVRLRESRGDDADAAYALGAYRALAWLCGHHDDRP
ncbi:hypothetical protein ACFC1R_24710 [Kitasatospora sp. NPDC056138]|uniref:hypothetical protein n=1 Tax=Kitasatospora sp. NPDC056138 TaxID=3345724 RepID=UPI0035E03C61